MQAAYVDSWSVIKPILKWALIIGLAAVALYVLAYIIAILFAAKVLGSLLGSSR